MATSFARILSELSDPTATEGGNVNGWNEHSPFALASLADCASPDSVDSSGARFLARVARDVAERFIDTDDYTGPLGELESGDGAHEIADSAVPVYTHERWQTFVDLAAYNEDASELGGDASDLTALAGVALYMIAERLVQALAEELSEALDESYDPDQAYADAETYMREVHNA
jgi:hypothetical protein